MALTEPELDYGYAQGFLVEWLKNSPPQVKEHLQILVDGINFYKDKVRTLEQDLETTNGRYNALTAQTAQYLDLMAQQKDLLDQTLMDNQREHHRYDEVPDI